MSDIAADRDDPDAAAPRPVILLLAFACGLVVANIYYVQPLVGLVSHTFGVPFSGAGLFVTVTQLGYAAGLVLVVPLGDIAENRRLILAMLALLVVALLAIVLAPNVGIFLAASLVLGLAATSVQVMVPLAGHLAPAATRGRVVGSVVSGLLFGIMLSRPAASFFAHGFGTRSIFVASAVAIALLMVLLAFRLPTRRPQGMPYGRALASLWPLLAQTPVLHRRGAYHAALFGAFSLFWTAVPLLLAGPRFGFSQLGIGLFALVGAGGALVSPFAGRAADAGHTKLVTGLALASAAISFGLAILGGLLASWPLLVVAGLVLDMATAANLVTGQREIFALNPEARGRLNGLFLALFFLGGAFGSYVAGLAFGAGGWTLACIVGAVLPLLALGYFATE